MDLDVLQDGGGDAGDVRAIAGVYRGEGMIAAGKGAEGVTGVAVRVYWAGAILRQSSAEDFVKLASAPDACTPSA